MTFTFDLITFTLSSIICLKNLICSQQNNQYNKRIKELKIISIELPYFLLLLLLRRLNVKIRDFKNLVIYTLNNFLNIIVRILV